jgi:multiple sugar transport system permease protein
MSDKNDDSKGMDFLQSMPRRWVTVYIPMFIFVIVLLFPFYWMTITAFKPDNELLSRDGNPFWIIAPTLAHFEKLLFRTEYPAWLWNTVIVSVTSTGLSLVASIFAAYAIERLRFQGAKTAGGAIFLAYLVPPSILFIPLAAIVVNLGLFDSRMALILTYPTFLIPFSTWLLMGYFRSIPYELEECARIDGANRWQTFWSVTFPMMTPVLFYNLVLGLIGTFQYFTEVYVATGGAGGPQRATMFYNLYLYQNAFKYFDMGYASTMAWILFVIVLCLTTLIFRSSDAWVYYEGQLRGK